MPSISRATNYLLHNRAQFLDSCVKNLGFLFSDKIYLTLRYRCLMGAWINWKNPQKFTEKIQWLKVYGYKDEYVTMVDKLAVKKHVSYLIGNEYIIPTIASWKSVKDIDLSTLPSQFVLKTTHAGGGCGVVVCKDKKKFNFDEAKKLLELSMSMVVGKEFRERPYYKVPKMLFAEQYMSDTSSDLIDYKFYCFNGIPRYCQVIRDRHIKESIDFYDMEWNLMPFVGLNPKCKNGNIPLPKPKCLFKMIDICRILSNNIPFARIDLYNINDHPYFGEITFYPGGGIGKFTPSNWDEKLGSLIVLPL